MSGPRDPDAFDDRPGEGGWHEPSHLGEGGSDPARGDAARKEPGRDEPAPASWEPPGWSLPPADRGSAAPAPVPAEPAPWRVTQNEVADVVVDPLDPYGSHAWAVRHGWTVSDGSGPQDAVLGDLLAAGPVRLGREHRPAGVMRGRFGTLDVVAFDVAFPLGRRVELAYAVTAAPLLGAVPRLRLSPARLWKHGTAGLLQIPSGDPEFDLRWVLLAAEDGPQVRALV